jgi:hypothetical protein
MGEVRLDPKAHLRAGLRWNRPWARDWVDGVAIRLGLDRPAAVAWLRGRGRHAEDEPKPPPEVRLRRRQRNLTSHPAKKRGKRSGRLNSGDAVSSAYINDGGPDQ